MKIRIITIHGIPNFGSVFQSYGLCKYLIDCGYEDTKVIDYNPPYYEKQGLKHMLGKFLFFKDHIIRKKKFRGFIESNVPLTKKSFTSYEDLSAYDFDADVYIAGGDQIWNVFHASGNDISYRLTFTNGKKISYGTSMGQKDFPADELKKLADDIRDFSSVSVREKSSVEHLYHEGVNATHVVDPVYLLERKEYEKFLKPVQDADYLFVYLVTPSQLLEDTIKYLKEKYNLKVILCSGFMPKCTCDKFIRNAGPEEILSYIKNARIVLSASFHATAFSIMFEKQFYTILPHKSTNERIESLLEVRNLSQRIVNTHTKFDEAFDREIDYSQVADYSKLIEESKSYLQKALEND